MSEQNILAKKTIDILQTIETAQTILKEKYQNNSNMWLDAVFEAIMIQNKMYLLEERKCLVENQDCSFLCEKISELFSESSPNGGVDEEDSNSDSLIGSSYSFVNTFSTFMSLLNKSNNGNLYDLVQDLRQIEKSIQTFIAQSEQVRTASREDVPSTEFTQKRKPILPRSKSTDMFDCKPNKNDNICTECNNKITIFNNDYEFSLSLHCQDEVHTRAIASAASRGFCFNFKTPKSSSSVSESELSTGKRSKTNSSFIDEIPGNKFYCKLCECEIPAPQNVGPHIEGSRHLKNLKSYTQNDGIFEVANSTIPVVDYL